jgi:hypothetical protein
MNKINFYLESRLANVKKLAGQWAKHNPDGAYKSALDHQVKYKRKGYIRYDTANHYHEGNLCLESLDGFDALPIQDVSRRSFDYSGYYADNFQDSLIKPYIVRIKTSKGLFVCPAIAYDNCDIATIYLSDGEFCVNNSDVFYTVCFQMASIADSIADREAERSREDDAKFQAENQADDLKAENLHARKSAHDLILAIKQQRKIGEIVTPICNALISEIKGLRREIQRNNERISKLKADYWQSVI